MLALYLAGFHVHVLCRFSVQVKMPDVYMQYSAVTQHKESILAMCSAMTDKKYINYTVVLLKSG